MPVSVQGARGPVGRFIPSQFSFRLRCLRPGAAWGNAQGQCFQYAETCLQPGELRDARRLSADFGDRRFARLDQLDVTVVLDYSEAPDVTGMSRNAAVTKVETEKVNVLALQAALIDASHGIRRIGATHGMEDF